MESRNNDFPHYLRDENDDLTEDLAQSLPVDEPEAGKMDRTNNGLAGEGAKNKEWHHRLGEELSVGREEKDFTD